MLAEEHYDAWDDFVMGQKRTGSIYGTARYLDILCRAAGGSFSVLATHDGDSFVAGVGLYRRRVDAHEVISTRMLLHYNGLVLRDSLLALEGSQSTRLELPRCTIEGLEPATGVLPHPALSRGISGLSSLRGERMEGSANIHHSRPYYGQFSAMAPV